MKKIILSIGNMHCVSCSANIDLTLEELKGIIKINTNYAKAQSEIVFDPQIITLQKIIKTIEEMGYKSSPKEELS